MEKKIRIYRKRYLPDEMIELKDDEILHRDENYILTKWNSLKPRKDISHGISAYFLKENMKVSKVFRKDGSLVYWYCDIIRTEYDPDLETYIFVDLVIDILIYENQHIKIVDLDELADLILKEQISREETALALKTADYLLKKIEEGSFGQYQDIVNQAG